MKSNIPLKSLVNSIMDLKKEGVKTDNWKYYHKTFDGKKALDGLYLQHVQLMQ